jgi:hypothetical protein
VTATKYLGEFEANSKEEAEQMALESNKNHVSLCHHCSNDLDLNDCSCQEVEAELIE